MLLFSAPKNPGMRVSERSPSSVENLVIRAIVGDQYAALFSRVRELIFVRNAPVSPPNVVNGNGIDVALTQALRDMATHIFVEKKAQAHAP